MIDLISLDNQIGALKKYLGRSYHVYLFSGESFLLKITGIGINENRILIKGLDGEGLFRQVRILEVESMKEN